MNAPELIAAAIADALNPSVKLEDVLFKVKGLAYILKDDHLKQWVNLEINGYAGSGVKVPKYRKIGIIPRVHLVHENFGFNNAQQPNQPMVMEYLEQDMQKALTSKYVNNSVAEIENMAHRDHDSTVDIPHPIHAMVSKKVYKPNGWHIYRAWQIIPSNQVKGVLSSIRSKVIELLFELKDLDDKVTIQSLQQIKAVSDTINKVLPTINVGAGGSVHMTNGDGTIQVTNSGASSQLNIASGNNNNQAITSQQAASLGELVENLKRAFAEDEAFDAHREEIAGELERIEVQLRKPEPKPTILKRSFESLKELATECAAPMGKMAAHAVFELLKQVPELLNGLPA